MEGGGRVADVWILVESPILPCLPNDLNLNNPKATKIDTLALEQKQSNSLRLAYVDTVWLTKGIPSNFDEDLPHSIQLRRRSSKDCIQEEAFGCNHALNELLTISQKSEDSDSLRSTWSKMVDVEPSINALGSDDDLRSVFNIQAITEPTDSMADDERSMASVIRMETLQECEKQLITFSEEEDSDSGAHCEEEDSQENGTEETVEAVDLKFDEDDVEEYGKKTPEAPVTFDAEPADKIPPGHITLPHIRRINFDSETDNSLQKPFEVLQIRRVKKPKRTNDERTRRRSQKTTPSERCKCEQLRIDPKLKTKACAIL
ncbi:unnamed protein product [Cylicocyclus nassatus]|uniref:Uncharacterized protein n=1 Tax=Cylicocyclus nassatus TaxID=53992 RepID=A0AA36DMM8_CYLNA|nr:unnamed protein product [Cylicocyclus nassatus]